MSNTVNLSHDDAGFITPSNQTRRPVYLKEHMKIPHSTSGAPHLPHEQTSATSARSSGPVNSVQHIWTKGSVRLWHVPRPRSKTDKPNPDRWDFGMHCGGSGSCIRTGAPPRSGWTHTNTFRG
ncbi:hypothetical protein OOU_Y34scaffold00090g14 [Pyricularia oryzae Y34]|uniref:Uncharacterized protein n=2 Tax=Pyricularia oryzae TaxID=318829 RepID=A0AA97P9E2_PYRO3|nr:hypothetical protein OOU_Y34scaffold00090g14 [Pyricularia oryzae Y34]